MAKTKPKRVLDLATGSGDLAKALARTNPKARVVAADFCLPMLDVARGKGVSDLVQADGLRLPFRDESFDAVTVAFGLRNMASWDEALREMARVLQPGGTLVVMDFSLPKWGPIRTAYRLYLHRVLPRFAGLVTGNSEAYEYLGESIEAFPKGAAMCELMECCGLERCRVHNLFFGVAAIYTATRHAGGDGFETT